MRIKQHRHAAASLLATGAASEGETLPASRLSQIPRARQKGVTSPIVPAISCRMSVSHFSRRVFLSRTTALTAAAGVLGRFPPNTAVAAPSTVAAAPAKPHFCLFTKHLIGMEPAALAEHVASLGFDGIEAPIRPEGHVLPEEVADKLPSWVETLSKANVKLTILTSGINTISPSQHTEVVLRTAAQLGIRYYRMNWFKYDLKKPLLPQLDEIRAKMKDLIALSKELGICPLSQNHNGPAYVGAAIWDLESLMRDHAPESWGFAYDIMHATIVGGTSWEIQYHLARPRIGAAFFKDFKWAGKMKIDTCPLGEGSAAGPEYARLLKKSDFAGPISLHIEYLKAARISNSEDEAAARAAAARDLATLKKWWAV